MNLFYITIIFSLLSFTFISFVEIQEKNKHKREKYFNDIYDIDFEFKTSKTAR